MNISYGEDTSLAPAGNRTPTDQPAARRCTDRAVPLVGLQYAFSVGT
jgi:hypothetical protein